MSAIGFEDLNIQVEKQIDQRQITPAHLKRWFGSDELSSGRPTYDQRLAEAGLDKIAVEAIAELYEQQLQSQVVTWHSQLAYVLARH